MSTNQHRNLQAKPAGADALESLQHMTAWARQSITSPEAAPMEPPVLGSMVDYFSFGATAFHAEPWVRPIDGPSEAIPGKAQPSRRWVGARAMLAIGGATVRFFRYMQERREIAQATRILSEMDDRSLQDIGITRADIGHAARHGREWGRWR